MEEARNMSVEQTIHMMFVQNLEIYSIPIIVSFGLIGNCISACIFLSEKLRKMSCSLYLAGRAISDSGFLLCILGVWLERVDLPIFHIQGVCQLEIYTSYLCGFLSVWFIVWVTIENYYRICQPFLAGSFCTVRKAKWVIFVTILFGVVLYSFSTWTNGVIHRNNKAVCFMKEKFKLVNTILTYSDCLVTLAVPSVIIVLITGRIVYSVMNNYRRQGSELRKGSCKLQTKVSRMLFCVSFIFLLLNLPSHIMRLRAVFLVISQHTTDTSPLFYSLQRTLQVIYYLSFAVNFLIYITLGQSFRQTLLRKFSACFYYSRRSIKTQPMLSCEQIPLRDVKVSEVNINPV